MFGEGLDTGDGGHGNGSPLITGNESARRQGQKLVIALRVASGRQRDGTEGPSTGCVGRGVVLKNLRIGTKVKSKGMVVREASAGNNAHGTERVGDAVAERELVETPYNIGDHVGEEKARKAFEQKPMGAGA